ncbi:MAG: TSUP family transporter [Gammaproteobacteria bacterium]|nr:TSUP family transporter [Gammaproteobacteria bacterium]
MTGGVLSGFAGLGGPVPLIWLQLQGGSPDSQRATYQPFNLVVLSLAAVAMLVAGRFDASLATIVAFCVPVTLAGARLGVAAYRRVGARGFERIILGVAARVGCDPRRPVANRLTKSGLTGRD